LLINKQNVEKENLILGPKFDDIGYVVHHLVIQTCVV